MGQGHQGELPCHLPQAPQEKLPESSGLLDQSVNRFGHDFAPGLAPFRGLQLFPHRDPQRCPCPGTSSIADSSPVVSLSPGRYVGINLPLRQHPQVVLTTVPRVRREPLWPSLFFGHPDS